jgi:hypothetical protein
VKSVLIVILVLLLTDCMMVPAKNKEAARSVAATPTAVSQPTRTGASAYGLSRATERRSRSSSAQLLTSRHAWIRRTMTT